MPMPVRALILFALFTWLSSHLLAKEETFFVTANEGIYLGNFDSETGKFGKLAQVAAVKNPNFLALSPDGKSLYATGHDFVAAFAVGANESLAPLNQLPKPGSEACHVSVDRTGRNVLVAEYDTGGVECFPRKPDGSLGEPTSHHVLISSGPDKARQAGAHAHFISANPENKFVYACDLGGDDIWIYKFDAAKGLLKANSPLLAKVPPGSGARHLVFDPKAPYVYVSNEMGHSVTAFLRDATTGTLTPFQTVITLAQGTSPVGVSTAEIACDATGRWLYVSNRGCDTITEFSIAGDGKLSLVQSVSSVAKVPRNFALDPSGRWLIAAGQNDNRLAVLRIDPANGKLTATDESAGVAAPSCVLFVPEKN
jgi:6-phosphogluconolactonase